MRLTIDNSVFAKMWRAERGTAEARRFFADLGDSGYEVHVPVLQLVENLVVWDKRHRDRVIDPVSVLALTPPGSRVRIDINYVDVTMTDVVDLYALADDHLRETLSKVQPAADLFYWLAARKVGATLETFDERLLATNGEVPVVRPAEVQFS